VSSNENAVSPGYFATLGIPLLAGRDFTDCDAANTPTVVILSEGFARFLFQDGNPLGRHVRIGSNDANAEVIGVVRDTRINDVREKPPYILYAPFAQGGRDSTWQSAFFIRTAGDERGMLPAVRQAVKQLDRNLPIERLTSMTLTIDHQIYTDRLMATLAIAFGLLAAVLAAVGLYGAISYSVARRTPEFGIRVALGESPRGLLLSVLREVGRIVGAGIATGLPVSYQLARLAESHLYGIRAHDPWTLGAATGLIALVGLCAGLMPALRVTHIDPANALRYE
jgi:predicted permease